MDKVLVYYWRTGADVLAGVSADARLRRYLEFCDSQAFDEQDRANVEVCRAYLDQLNRMLELARRVQTRPRPPR